MGGVWDLRPRTTGWLVLLAALLAPLLLRSPSYQNLLVLTAINVILVASLDLLIGLSGLVSLGHAAFWGIGAYTSALLVMRVGVPFLLALLAAGLAAACAGVFIGYPSLRLRGHFFVLVSFIFGIIVTLLLTSLVEVTRGPMGLPGIPFASLPVPGGRVVLNTFQDKVSYYYMVLTFAVLTLWIHSRVARSRMGRALVAVREDEDLGQTLGIDTHRYKVGVFALSTACAGVAGSLYAHYTTFLAPEIFDFVASFDLFVMNLVGGPGTSAGAILGPVLLTAVRDALRNAHPVLGAGLFGVFLILTIAFLPGGLVGSWQRVAGRTRR
jgi:branched-chain amino acid transport system permease protein